MSVDNAIKSIWNPFDLSINIKLSAELPQVTLNRMCYGYLFNDWIVVISSVMTLMVTVVSLIFVSIDYISSN
jgi:hypothetical protein